MLMIVGLLLFIVVSLVLYLSKYAVKRESDVEIKESQTSDVQPIITFVNLCLERLSREAVALLGKQGGYIYQSQGGPLADFSEADMGKFFLKYNDDYNKDYNVAYNIFPLKFPVGIYSAVPPEYPWWFSSSNNELSWGFPYLTNNFDVEVFAGIFGLNGMPPLEKSHGPQSIQLQIESYINNNLPSCMDFRPFEEQGFEIDAQPANSSIVIGNKDMTVEAKIPLTVKNAKTSKITKIEDFSIRLDLRLKEMYSFVRNLINSDITNIKFNINSASNSIGSFEIKMKNDFFKKDDLLIVTDKDLLIYGIPFEYAFARKNRPPALYYYKTPLTFDRGHYIIKNDLLNSNNLKAEDPDEDRIYAHLTIDDIPPSSFRISPRLPFLLGCPCGEEICHDGSDNDGDDEIDENDCCEIIDAANFEIMVTDGLLEDGSLKEGRLDDWQEIKVNIRHIDC